MTMRVFGVVLAAGVLFGCSGGDPVQLCEDDYAAQKSCAEEAGVDIGFDLLGICEIWSLASGSTKKQLVNGYECSIDVWNDADCSAEAGYDAALVEVDACFPDAA